MRDRRGAAAVEFALIVPLLLLVYIGCSEAAIAYSISNKMENATSIINNLVSRVDTLSSSDLANVFGLGALVLNPNDTAPLTMRVTAVAIDAAGNSTVKWTCSLPKATGSAAGNAIPLPSSLASLRSTVVIKTEAHYTYTPLSGLLWSKPIDIAGTGYIKLRYSADITSTGC